MSAVPLVRFDTFGGGATKTSYVAFCPDGFSLTFLFAVDVVVALVTVAVVGTVVAVMAQFSLSHFVHTICSARNSTTRRVNAEARQKDEK